ncbi:MAG: hypothetical protein M1815_003193 [Lichina confinis]|nr:MAG: hypothetical protein M1815_003193 [Lichina confinis]
MSTLLDAPAPHRAPVQSSYWQETLHEHCKAAQLHPPVWNLLSDKRGGRTAWSSTVRIQGQEVSARYWYDGGYINNAKEDAAEVALQQLRSSWSASG